MSLSHSLPSLWGESGGAALKTAAQEANPPIGSDSSCQEYQCTHIPLAPPPALPLLQHSRWLGTEPNPPTVVKQKQKQKKQAKYGIINCLIWKLVCLVFIKHWFSSFILSYKLSKYLSVLMITAGIAVCTIVSAKKVVSCPYRGGGGGEGGLTPKKCWVLSLAKHPHTPPSPHSSKLSGMDIRLPTPPQKVAAFLYFFCPIAPQNPL